MLNFFKALVIFSVLSAVTAIAEDTTPPINVHNSAAKGSHSISRLMMSTQNMHD